MPPVRHHLRHPHKRRPRENEREPPRQGQRQKPRQHGVDHQQSKPFEAAEDHLVKRLKALRTYFDLSDEELESMTLRERADAIRQHRLITEALAAFNQALVEKETEE